MKTKSTNKPPAIASWMHPRMLAFYVRSAVKHILKTPVYSFINVLGLTLGVSACLAVYLIARHELSYDNFHADRDRIYRLVTEAVGPAGTWHGSTVAQPLPAVVGETVSGIESIASINRFDAAVKLTGPDGIVRKFPATSTKAAIIDPQYFDILPRHWIAGSPAQMVQPFNAVLTQSRAQFYFNMLAPESIIGRTITYDDSLEVTIIGIVSDWDENSDFAYSEFISRETLRHSFLKSTLKPDDWQVYNNSFQSLVKVYPGTSIDSLAKKITHTLLTHAPPNDKVTFSSQLQPLGDVHFDKRGGTATEGEKDLYRLIGLGVFVLVIACINFINLSTALSTTRLKEVGIRKTVGASGGNIIMQLLTETIVVSALSTVLACALVRPILNLFANFVPPDISLHLFSVRTLLFLLGLLSVTAAFAGFYPATVLSSYSPSSAVRKSSALPTGNSGWLRKTFITFQFVFSICFITGVIVMKSQLQFIREKDRGFTTDNIRMFWTNFDDTSNHPRVLAERIRQITGVAQVSVHGGSPMGFATFMNNVSLSENKERVLDVVLKSGDANYIPLYGIRIQAGRNIHQSDSLREFVVNETLVHALGFDKPEDALGHHLNYFGKDYPIVGVVADFHQQSFHGPIPPIAIGNITGVQHGLAFKLDDNAVHANVVSVINKIEKVFKEIYPDDTFQPHLVEEEIGWMHQDDTRLAKLIDVAAAATVFISALGVFGLVMFTSQTRVKEIAIRKVLGASVSSIASMLAREFAILLAAANVFAIPVAWYTMDKWLATFSYRVHLSATMFLTATLLAFFVGLITVCYHTLKSALAPPVTSLRTD